MKEEKRELKSNGLGMWLGWYVFADLTADLSEESNLIGHVGEGISVPNVRSRRQVVSVREPVKQED